MVLDILKEILRDFLPAVANAQQKPSDKATVNKVIPPADAALSALNAVLVSSAVDPEDRILPSSPFLSIVLVPQFSFTRLFSWYSLRLIRSYFGSNHSRSANIAGRE